MKKILSIIVALAICFMLSVSSFASELQRLPVEENSTLYIETIPVPNEATEYAVDIFSRLHAYDFEAMGFTNSEMNRLSLSPGFCMINAYTGEYIDNVYYYLIKSGNTFVGSLVISYYNGKYGFQISKTDYSVGMNSVERSLQASYKIAVGNGNYYSCSNEKVSDITYKKSSSFGVRGISKSNIDSFDSYRINVIDSVSSAPQNLYNTNEYYILNVPGCNNTYNDNGIGLCWASAAASVVVYTIDGDSSTRYKAEQFRDTILDMKYASNKTKLGDIYDICNYIKLFVSNNYNTIGGKPSFLILKSLFYMGSPCVISYYPIQGSYRHAVVLRGFSCLSSDPHNES